MKHKQTTHQPIATIINNILGGALQDAARAVRGHLQLAAGSRVLGLPV